MESDAVSLELVEEQAEEKPRYWGFWATIGFSLLVAFAYLVANIAVVVVFMVAKHFLDPAFDPMSTAEPLEHNGLLLSVASMMSTPVEVGLVVLFIRFRRGITLGQYLGLHRVSYRTLAFWLAATGLFIVCTDGLTHATGHDIVPPFMTDAWQTAGWLPLLWLALIVLAPLSEESSFVVSCSLACNTRGLATLGRS